MSRDLLPPTVAFPCPPYPPACEHTWVILLGLSSSLWCVWGDMSVCLLGPQLGRRQHECIWILRFCCSSVGVPGGALHLQYGGARQWISVAALTMAWEIFMPEHSGFHASLIKILIPKPSIKLLTLVKF